MTEANIAVHADVTADMRVVLDSLDASRARLSAAEWAQVASEARKLAEMADRARELAELRVGALPTHVRIKTQIAEETQAERVENQLLFLNRWLQWAKDHNPRWRSR